MQVRTESPDWRRLNVRRDWGSISSAKPATGKKMSRTVKNSRVSAEVLWKKATTTNILYPSKTVLLCISSPCFISTSTYILTQYIAPGCFVIHPADLSSANQGVLTTSTVDCEQFSSIQLIPNNIHCAITCLRSNRLANFYRGSCRALH